MFEGFAEKKSISKSWKVWVGLLVGLGFLYLAIRNTDFAETTALIKRASLLPLFMSLLVRVGGLWLRGVRWQVVLKPIKAIAAGSLFQIISVAEMGNYILPSRLGELIRVVSVAKREAISKSAALASVAVDRFLDLLALLILFASCTLVFEFPGVIREVGYAAGMVLVSILCLTIMLLRNKGLVDRVVSTLFARLPGVSSKLTGLADRFFQGLSVLNEMRSLLLSIGLSLVLWLIYSLAFYLVLLALGMDLPWYGSFAIAATIGLAEAIPSTAGYVGTIEFFGVAALSTFAFDKTAALACTVVAHGLQYLVVVVLGVVNYFALTREVFGFDSGARTVSLGEVNSTDAGI